MKSQTLGRYVLLRRLAAGGMGEVYLAEKEGAANFRKQVAIKRILPHLATNPDFVSKFIDEAHVMVQLHHGNIVPVLELADEEGELYLVMEYLPGRDLKAVIRRLRADNKRMEPELACWLVAEVCAGLDYAHRKVGADGQPLGIVHRDVSPSNVCLGAGGEVKLVDFGIARARGGLHQSISGTLQGKFVYMSPEQADGRGLDARADVFSAGLVLYELICGLRPFEGESETETLRLVRQASVEPPSSVRRDLDPALDEICMRALSRDPDARYATAAEFRRALQHYLADQRSEADARALVGFLSDLFPEGVVPPAEEPTPLSVDDALLMQLGQLTPSVDAFGRTRTNTGESQRSRPSTPSTATIQSARRATDSVSGFDPPTITESPHPPHRTGRRRFVLLGLLIGLGASAALWYGQRPDPAWLAPQVPKAAEATAKVTVDGRPYTAETALEAGDSHWVCVEAEMHLKMCDRVDALTPGINKPPFALPKLRMISPVIVPPGIGVTIRVNGRLVESGRQVRRIAQEDTHVCVRAGGYETQPAECQNVPAGEDTAEPHFELVPIVEAEPDAAPEPDAADAGTKPNPKPRRPRVRYLRLTSTPTADVWRGIRRVGTTPHRFKIESVAVELELRAAGHASKRFTVRPNHRGKEAHIRLERPGSLDVRAVPGAAEIFVAGRRLGEGLVQGHSLAPGKYVVEARFRYQGKVHKARQSVDIRSGAKERVVLQIKLPESPP